MARDKSKDPSSKGLNSTSASVKAKHEKNVKKQLAKSARRKKAIISKFESSGNKVDDLTNSEFNRLNHYGMLKGVKKPSHIRPVKKEVEVIPASEQKVG